MFERLQRLWNSISSFLRSDIIKIPIDGRFRPQEGPQNLSVNGEVLGKAKPRSPFISGTSHVISIPFSQSYDKTFQPFEVLEGDGRRTIVLREVKEDEMEAL